MTSRYSTVLLRYRYTATAAFVARQILAIPGSAIECERVFSAAGIVTGLLRNMMTPQYLHHVVFLSKNFPFEQELGMLQEAQEIVTQFEEQLGANSEPEVVEKALAADELAHQVELDVMITSPPRPPGSSLGTFRVRIYNPE